MRDMFYCYHFSGDHSEKIAEETDCSILNCHIRPLIIFMLVRVNEIVFFSLCTLKNKWLTNLLNKFYKRND